MQSRFSPFYLFGSSFGSPLEICSCLGCSGGKISKKTCFVEETVLVKRRGLTLLKSTLSSLPIYFMSLFVISCKVSLRVEKIQMDFLGVGGKGELQSRPHFVR